MQPISLDRWLEVSSSHFDPVLVDAGALTLLRETARSLPGDSVAAVEVRLGAAGPVDLSVRVAQPAQARHLASRVGPPHLRALLARWARDARLRERVPAVWLEFDLDGRGIAPSAPPVPSVCAQLAPACGRGWLMDRLLPALHGRPLAAAERRTLRRCCDAIPAGVRLLYVFSMLSRRAGCTRLELMAPDSGPLLEVLARVAPRAARQLAPYADLGRGSDRCHLSLDVAAGVSPRCGMEWSFAAPPRREPHWAELFARLAERGLASVERSAAVFAWPGCDRFWNAPRNWPVEGGGIAGACVRSLSHVKLVNRPGQLPEAKAYLLLAHHDPHAAAAEVPGPGIAPRASQ
ncbi:MAG TPA: hypothetical protein VJA16_01070 [Thermoanaerobaculia bacterium]